MKTLLAIGVGVMILMVANPPASGQNDYRLGPDSQCHEGVPRGTVTKYTQTSTVYPGSVHDYWVYVPVQYDPAKPACVMIFQDGGGFQDVNGGLRAPVVLDNLIHKREIPVTIAIMINPGVVPAANADALPRFNRSFEYDAMSDRYAEFLTREILPEVGKRYTLTTDPNGRALCGLSSGGIASFTAAWERPDQFRRVISFVGSFTNLRGGHNYPWMIRKFEPKPIQVFLQDGSNDQDIYSGSWFIGNNDVAAALKYATYDYQYVVGTGGHDGRQAGAILPDAIRWIWKHYPAPIKIPETTPQPIQELLPPGSLWIRALPEDLLVGRAATIGGLTSDPAGNVFFSTPSSNAIYRVDLGGSTSLFRDRTNGVTGLAWGSDGKLYGCQPKRTRILRYDPSERDPSVAAGGITCEHLVIDNRGTLYATDSASGRIWSVQANGNRKVFSEGVHGASGLTLTPDQTHLLVTEKSSGKFAWSFQIDGTAMKHGEAYFDLYVPHDSGGNAAEGMTTDTQGRLYVATAAGIQVCDQAGRVIGILENPDRLSTRFLTFGGKNRGILYAGTFDGRLYWRQLRTTGVRPFEPPIKPPAPRL